MNMTNDDILAIAAEQSALDLGCSAADFFADANTVVPLNIGAGARRYFHRPIACDLTSYGSCVVAAAEEPYLDIVRDYVGRFTFYHCFETPNMHVLDGLLAPFGSRVCFMAEYFLPDVGKLRPLGCVLELRVLEHDDLAGLYQPEWGNALSFDDPSVDVLGVGAYDGGRLAGLAACSADCAKMWQIGVDVLPEYRRAGVASALTSRLCVEILERGTVPFYCSAWSNIRSVRNALRSGLRPAWVEMTAKPAAVVDEINAG